MLFLPWDAQARNALHGAGGLLTCMDDADNVPLPPSVTKPAMSNKELEDRKTILAREKGYFGMSM